MADPITALRILVSDDTGRALPVPRGEDDY
jgi:hypothetical protein